MPVDDTRGEAARTSAYADAEAAIRHAEANLSAMFGGDRPARPSPPTAVRDDGWLADPEPAPQAGSPPPSSRTSSAATAVAATPTPRIRRPLRRRLGGLGITLAFIPVGLIGSAAVIGGCGDGGGGATAAITGAGTAEPSGTPPAFKPEAAKANLSKQASVIARIPARKVRVYTRPKAKAKHRVVRARTLEGAKLPLVMLVKQRRGKWLQVYLPTRPNLSKGWIRRSSVKLRQTTFRVKIELKAHRISVWNGKKRVLRKPIGVGRSLTPTPTGQYYVTSLIKPPNPGGTYGPYAFGLSGHSPVLTTFAGGNGQLGLHGTDNPSALGSDVSHGCIRVRNGVIRELAGMLPIGTPLAIRS